MKSYVILGSNGQTASYLIERILESGFQVVGISRSRMNDRLIYSNNYIHVKADLTSPKFDLRPILTRFKPTSVINLAALSSVAACESNPLASEKINFDFVVKCVRKIIEHNDNFDQKISFIQASSSEMFAGGSSKLIDETSVLSPISTYGRHKAMAHEYVSNLNYLNILPSSCLILFNHESPRRPATFVSQKIVLAARELSRGSGVPLQLGDTTITRDWGYAKEYAKAIFDLTQEFNSKNYVIASGELHSIFEFVERAFAFFKVPLNESTFQKDRTLFRKLENSGLAGDASMFKRDYSWNPTTSFEELVEIMCRRAGALD